MVYTLVQILIALGCFMALGQAIAKESKLSDKIMGWTIFALFSMFILYIQEVLK